MHNGLVSKEATDYSRRENGGAHGDVEGEDARWELYSTITTLITQCKSIIHERNGRRRAEMEYEHL